MEWVYSYNPGAHTGQQCKPNAKTKCYVMITYYLSEITAAVCIEYNKSSTHQRAVD